MKFYHKNPRAVTEKQFGNLRETLPELGDLGGIVHDLNSDEVIGGNQRVRAMGLLGVEPVIVERYDPPNDQGTVAVGYYEVNGEQFKYRAVMWTPRQCEKANIVANKAGGTWDFDTLANDFDMENDLLEWGFEEGELVGWGTGEEPPADEGGEPLVDYVPDAIFPSDNTWGVPTLDLAFQADFVELPWTKWGDGSRKATMRGTYHFYTEDYKFNKLWSDPLDLVNSRCVAMVEPNVSSNEQMPMAACLWGIYRKRWLARYCQSYGARVFVDLNVTPKAAELNLLGVPLGWKAYATRGQDKMLNLVDTDYEIAKDRAGCAPVFVVYGGGKKTEAHCQERGFVWLPENMHEKDGRRDG